MNETLTAPIAQIRKCRIEEVFDTGFIELIKLVPGNPLVRALVLKFAGIMPGEECATFEQVKDWVEFHYAKLIRKIKATPGRNNNEGGLVVNVDFTETEYGRAHYSVQRSGNELFRLGADALLEIVQAAIEDGDGMEDIVETIAEKIDEDAWEACSPDLDNYGDYDYEDHDSTDSGNCSVDCSKSEIRDAVRAFIHEQHPELAAEL